MLRQMALSCSGTPAIPTQTPQTAFPLAARLILVLARVHRLQLVETLSRLAYLLPGMTNAAAMNSRLSGVTCLTMMVRMILNGLIHVTLPDVAQCGTSSSEGWQCLLHLCCATLQQMALS